MGAKDPLGEDCQQAVETYLESCGFRVLDRNWQSPEGGIDFIVAEHRILVVFDIRTGTGRWPGNSVNLLSQARQTRLRRLAVNWLSAHGMRFEQIRIDIIGLIYEGTGGYTIEHVRNVG